MFGDDSNDQQVRARRGERRRHRHGHHVGQAEGAVRGARSEERKARRPWLFVENGVEDMEMAKLLCASELDEIGVKFIGQK